MDIRQIPVTIDKSHLITIGEKLYAEKMSFIRELVNNAYDADATEVRVSLADATIGIRDNGSGMDEQGLRQYFTIGSPAKKTEPVSPRFHRKRIGEFGIGKFAALAACKEFGVSTQKGGFRAELLFDKETWSRHEDWHLNIDVVPADSGSGNGTTITLRELDVRFIPGRVRRYLAERTPIHATNFSVFLNGEKVSDEIVAGRQLPVEHSTPFGPIRGTVIITASTVRREHQGIAIFVKGVLVRYETFNMDGSPPHHRTLAHYR